MKTENLNDEKENVILNIDQFLLNNQKEKQNQEFFHFILF